MKAALILLWMTYHIIRVTCLTNKILIWIYWLSKFIIILFIYCGLSQWALLMFWIKYQLYFTKLNQRRKKIQMDSTKDSKGGSSFLGLTNYVPHHNPNQPSALNVSLLNKSALSHTKRGSIYDPFESSITHHNRLHLSGIGSPLMSHKSHLGSHHPVKS